MFKHKRYILINMLNIMWKIIRSRMQREIITKGKFLASLIELSQSYQDRVSKFW